MRFTKFTYELKSAGDVPVTEPGFALCKVFR